MAEPLVTLVQTTCVAPTEAACSKASVFAFRVAVDAESHPHPDDPRISVTGLQVDTSSASATFTLCANAEGVVAQAVVRATDNTSMERLGRAFILEPPIRLPNPRPPPRSFP
jgi:hypothetical protein